MAFWHPVGAFSGESLLEIIDRKTREINKYGYTLWSFAAAKQERIEQWRQELNKQECSIIGTGIKTKDPNPHSETWAIESSDNLSKWNKIPEITSYHKRAGKNGILASAFVITKVQTPNLLVERPNNWFRSSDGIWINDHNVPSRGQYLIKDPKFGTGKFLVRVLLETTFPYVVWLK